MLLIWAVCSVDLSNFYTYIVTDMSYMFGRCSSLTNINLSNFYTYKSTIMSFMFDGCSKLNKNNIITNDIKISKNKYD